jgi:phytanoyl-CoA hydroxylase
MESLEGVSLLVPDEKRRLLNPVAFPVRAGSCTFHAGLTLHFAGPNTTDRPRLGFIINYIPDGIRYSGQKHVTTDPLHLTPNQPIAGDLFPVLASA